MANLILAPQHVPPVSLAFAAHPNLAVAAGTCGCALIFWEFNRPGRILPAAFGLLVCLLATAGLIAAGLQLWAVGLLLIGAAALLLNIWRQVPRSLLVFATAAIVVGLRFLLPEGAPTRIHLSVAMLCGGLLGVVSALLTSIAYRARRAKALD